jgi:prepilin-type N-terminal cleavage/methylation domain-containing protein/prepilin-type processing-associated H-X9-DG protein
MQKRTGFTLIELLVVIAIIAILAAILFPVFARARAKAQQTNCLNNVKQFALSVLMYASDYDQKGPLMGVQDVNVDATDYTMSLMPYLKNQQILKCPSLTGTYKTDYSTPYSLNGELANTSLEMAKQPAKTFMIIESAYGYTYYSPGIWKDPAQIVWEACNVPDTLKIHNDGINCAWVDGHAKWVKPDSISAYDRHPCDRAVNAAQSYTVDIFGADVGAGAISGWLRPSLDP